MTQSSRNQLGGAIAALALSISTTIAAANTLVVTNTNDYSTGAPIAGSLRYEIAQANANDTVSFDPSLKGKTIKLTGGQLVLSKSLTINGLGSSWITVSGNGSSRVFYVAPGVAATLANLKLTLGNGNGPDLSGAGNDANGGAILNNGSLALSFDAVTASKTAGSGGAIFNSASGALSVSDSTIAQNTANRGPSTAPQSNGGAIADLGTLTIQRSTLSNNRSFGDGGAIEESGTLTIVNSTFSGNKASGVGGGIADSGNGATISLYDTTVANNSATAGGGIGASAQLPTSWNLANTIVANDTASTGPDISDSFGVVISLGYNIIGNTAGTASGNFIASDKLNVKPKLGPLQDNGGPTFTLAELPGSPSIDAGSNSLIPSGVTTDQRGFGRVNGASVDIGAFEFYAPKDLKQFALSLVTSNYNTNPSDWEGNWDLSVAKTLINASLKSTLWSGSDTSRLSHWGELDFEFEEGAASALEDIVDSGSGYSAVAQAVIDDLVMADNILALTAINDAISANGSSDYIKSAQSEMVEGQSALSKNDYARAIEEYEHAWIDAERAVSVTTGWDDGSDEQERASVR